jgi:hypothetical protein
MRAAQAVQRPVVARCQQCIQAMADEEIRVRDRVGKHHGFAMIRGGYGTYAEVRGMYLTLYYD